MAKRFLPFGASAVDALVKNFLESKGIDPKEITGYRLSRSVDDIGTISFDMHFDDIPRDDITIYPPTREE